MSRVLYRKYRSQSFSEFIGQEHIVRTVTNAIANDMISHAYLFSGPRGSGKTTLARLLAKAINCETRKKGESEPCNKCSSCTEITEGRSIDLLEIDAASHRGIDDIRELRDGVRFAPTKSKYKIFIIDESHQLTKEAANALLKTLEEPPSHAIFILATTEAYKMIPTIISRCQRFDFRKLTFPEIIAKLEMIAKREKVKIEKPALQLIASNSEGSLRDAESLMDQVFALNEGLAGEIKAADVKGLLGLVETESVIAFSDFLCQKKLPEAINFLNEIGEKSLDFGEFIKVLINYLRKVMVFKITGGDDNSIIAGLTQEEVKRLKEQSIKFTEGELVNILNLLLDAQSKMKYSPLPQLPLELAVVEAIGPKE